MKRKILIFSVDLVPIPGYPISGGGLRAWGLGEGLKSRGHEVIYSVPDTVFSQDKKNPKWLTDYAYNVHNLDHIIERVLPDIILFEQWGLATYLRDSKIPVVIDLHGSLTLENTFRERSNIATDTLTKIRTLRDADLIICAGEKQRMYFLSWMIMSGFDPKDIGIEVIPVSFSPDMPAKSYKDKKELEFVFGGNLWPWIDPFPCLNILVDKIEKEKRGKLTLFTGVMDYQERSELIGDDKGIYNIFIDKINKSKRCTVQGFLSHSQLINRYKSASVAVDVYKRNLEREIAFTTRTVEYLWSGLPVIYGNYAELADYIKAYKAGWVVDPDDEDRINEVLDQIYSDSSLVEKYSKNAQQLVKDKLTWDKTIDPLDKYCQNPVFRKKNATILTNFKDHLDRVEYELRKREQDHHSLQKELKDRVDQEKVYAQKIVDSLNKQISDRDKEINRLHGLEVKMIEKMESERINHDNALDKIKEQYEKSLLKEKEVLKDSAEREISKQKKHFEDGINVLKDEKDELKRKLENEKIRYEQRIEKLDDRIFFLTEELRPKINTLEKTLEDKNLHLKEYEEKLEALNNLNEEKDKSLAENNNLIQSIQRELDNKNNQIENLNFQVFKHSQESDHLRGILRSIKNKKSFKLYKFFKTGMKRIFLNYPRLFYLFFVNLITNAYMSRWVKKNNQRIFPAQ